MNISITEALRIKNEVKGVISNLSYIHGSVAFGDTFEDGIKTSVDKETFPEYEQRLIKALKIAEDVNNAISKFNRTRGVDKMVREKENKNLLIKIYSQHISKFKETTTTKIETTANGRVNVLVKYVPFTTAKDVKEEISRLKKSVREIQNQVERANNEFIDVGFTYDDVDSLNIAQ